MTKISKLAKRHKAIRELIASYPIEDHGMLIDLLKEKYGFETNQAAISRDLRSLGIYKRIRNDTMVYELPSVDVVHEILHHAIRSIHHNDALIVVKTVPGTADFVGDFLDSQTDLAILATLSGENTVFIAPKNIKTIKSLFVNICQRLKIQG